MKENIRFERPDYHKFFRERRNRKPIQGIDYKMLKLQEIFEIDRHPFSKRTLDFYKVEFYRAFRILRELEKEKPDFGWLLYEKSPAYSILTPRFRLSIVSKEPDQRFNLIMEENRRILDLKKNL